MNSTPEQGGVHVFLLLLLQTEYRVGGLLVILTCRLYRLGSKVTVTFILHHVAGVSMYWALYPSVSSVWWSHSPSLVIYNSLSYPPARALLLFIIWRCIHDLHIYIVSTETIEQPLCPLGTTSPCGTASTTTAPSRFATPLQEGA